MIALVLAATTAGGEEKSPPQAAQDGRRDHATATIVPAAAPPTSFSIREKQFTIAYDVDELLATLRQDGFDDAATRGVLETWAAGAIVPANSASAQPPYGLRTILWLNGRLVVQTSEAGHKQVRETFETLRKFGPAEIAVDVRFISLDEEEMKAMLADGLTAAASVPEPAGGDASLQGCDGERPLANHEGTQVARAQCVVERDSPLGYRIMDADEGKKWLDRRQGDKRSSTLQAPRVMVLNGQTAHVMETTQTPFVVGVKEVGAGRAPQIRIVSEGTTLQLRPIADRSGRIHIDFAATFSKIHKVETVTFGGEGSGKVTLQVPEVATLRLEGGAALKSGQWFVLVGSQASVGQPDPAPAWERFLGGGKQFKAHPSRQLVLMLRAEKLPQPQAMKVASTQGPVPHP